MALFQTYYCPRLKKNIAFCNEPNQKQFINKVKLYPVPCIYFYGGKNGFHKCQYKGDKDANNGR